MHSKFLVALSLSSMALGQLDDLEDYLGDYDLGDYDLGDYSSYYEDLMSSLTDLGDLTSYSDYYTDYLPTGTSFGAVPTGSSDDIPDLSDIPKSVISAIQSVAPDSYLENMENPSYASSVYHDLQNGEFPSWFGDLPSDVQKWIEENLANVTSGGTALPTSIPTGTGGNSPSSTSDTDLSDQPDEETEDLQNGEIPESLRPPEDAASTLSGSIVGSVLAAAGILGITLLL